MAFKIGSAWLDRFKVNQAAKEVYLALLHVRQLHGPNVGIDISKENSQEWAIARRVCLKHPECQVISMGSAFTLVMKNQLDKLSGDLRGSLEVGPDAVQMESAEVTAQAHKEKRSAQALADAEAHRKDVDEAEQKRAIRNAKMKADLDAKLLKENPSLWNPILGKGEGK